MLRTWNSRSVYSVNHEGEDDVLKPRLIVIGLIVLVSAGATLAEEGFVKLFDGQTLDGWKKRGGKATFTVVDNMIEGTSHPNSENTFLCTEKSYGDFILTFEFQCDSELNSGVQFRSECFDRDTEIAIGSEKKKMIRSGRVHGYQYEIDPNKAERMWTAGIYDEGRRGWLFPGPAGGENEAFTKNGQRAFDVDGWNSARIECRADHIRTWLNGDVRADFHDDSTLTGFVALQVHGVGGRTDPLKVRFRNIQIKDLGLNEVQDGGVEQPAGWVRLFNGKNLLGWHVGESPESFYVENRCIVANGPPAMAYYVGPTGQASFKDFHFKAKVKTLANSNSGVYFHCRYQYNGWPQLGYEAQINNSHPDTKRTGGLYNFHDVYESFAQDDEWFDYEIIVKGKQVVIKINGLTTCDYTEPNNLARLDHCLSSGTIALQAHDPGSKVYFKDMMLKSLD